MKPIIAWGLRLRKTALLWWIFGIVVFVAIELAFYPSLHNNAQQLNQSLAQLPQAVKNLIGGSDYASPIGYLNGRVFYLVLPAMLAIVSIGLGSSLVGKEEDANTLELLLSTPISRSRLLLAKAWLGLGYVSAITLTGLISIVLMAALVKIDIPLSNLLLTTLGTFLLAICLGSLSFMLTALGGRFKSAASGVAAAWALGGYVITSLAPNFAWLKPIARGFAFYYYRPEQLLRSHPVYWPLLVLVLFIAVFATLSWWGFNRRDLKN